MEIGKHYVNLETNGFIVAVVISKFDLVQFI